MASDHASLGGIYYDWRDKCPDVEPPSPYPAACQRCLMLNDPGAKTCALCSTPLAAPMLPGGLRRSASGSSSTAEVVDLTTTNWERTSDGSPWLLEFYAPWWCALQLRRNSAPLRANF